MTIIGDTNAKVNASANDIIDMEKKKKTVDKNKKKLLHNWTDMDFGNLNSFRKKMNANGILINNIKKYLPHTTCKKWISVDKYLAIPSINGKRSHPHIFKI